jgi:hypothetical protein
MREHLSILKRIPLKFKLRLLEKKIDRGWNRDLSLRIDAALAALEKSQ